MMMLIMFQLAFALINYNKRKISEAWSANGGLIMIGHGNQRIVTYNFENLAPHMITAVYPESG
jgi:hypothetical protein